MKCFFQKKILLLTGVIYLFIPFTVNAATSLEYQKVKFNQLPGWQDGSQADAINALKRSCQKILISQPKSTNDRSWHQACQSITHLPNKLNNHQARIILSSSFIPYQVFLSGETTGLFTGYYAPTYQGSPVKTDYFTIPIYKRPKDLVVRKNASGKNIYGRIVNGQFTRYYSRKEISDHNYFTQKDVIAWVHDKIDRSFLQIQGSGRIEFPNGENILVSYDGQNGWPYRPIGQYLIQKGDLTSKTVSMQSIKKWLEAHPKEVDSVLNYDPSFVFFKVTGHGNLIGAEGTQLTPGYSIAVDWRYTDYGTPIWLDSYYPTPSGKKPLNRLLIAQDTGGAIRGPIRGDIFWGNSEHAEYTAGHMKSSGKMWVLLPKGYEI